MIYILGFREIVPRGTISRKPSRIKIPTLQIDCSANTQYIKSHYAASRRESKANSPIKPTVSTQETISSKGQSSDKTVSPGKQQNPEKHSPKDHLSKMARSPNNSPNIIKHPPKEITARMKREAMKKTRIRNTQACQPKQA